MELLLADGIVTMPVEALATNLTHEELGVIVTFKGAFEALLRDPEMKEDLSVKLNDKLKDEKILAVMRSLKERGIFEVVTEGKSIRLCFDLDKV